MDDKLLEGLNERQKEVILSKGGHQLVIASAGSGKTLVLVRRVAYLIDQGVSPDRILLLTFTRKAANEMKERAVELLDKRAEGIDCGTFHSFSLKILRMFANKIGIQKNFDILDSKDEYNLIQLIIKTSGLKVYPNTLGDIFGLHINTGASISEVCTRFNSVSPYEYKKIEELFKYHMKYKKDHGLMTFDDMLYYCLKALKEKSVQKIISTRYKYILVDEFQDTNNIQVNILKILEKGNGNILGVGDDSQSVYKFRGADYKNILSFPKVFKNCEIIKLEQNYRSTAPILDLANKVCSTFVHKFDKEMFTDKKTKSNTPIYYRVESEEVQAQMVAEQIQQMISSGKYMPHDCAVLYRANSSSELIFGQLNQLGIPCRKEGDRSLFDRAHIRDMIALLKCVYYPNDIVSWNRVLLFHPTIGATTVNYLTGTIIDENKGLDALKYVRVRDKQREVLTNLFDTLNKVRSYKSPEKCLTFLYSYYKTFLERYSNLNDRIKDIRSLIKLSSNYKYCRQMLTDMMLDPETEQKFNGVALSTIHGAKGLEWKNVWLINVTGQKFPSSYFCKTEEDMEEEKRLFYVAITRAKENLFIYEPMFEEEVEGIVYGKDIDEYHSNESPFITQNENIKELMIEKYSPDIEEQINFHNNKGHKNSSRKYIYDEYI